MLGGDELYQWEQNGERGVGLGREYLDEAVCVYLCECGDCVIGFDGCNDRSDDFVADLLAEVGEGKVQSFADADNCVQSNLVAVAFEKTYGACVD